MMNNENVKSRKTELIDAYYKMIAECYEDEIIAESNQILKENPDISVPSSLDDWFYRFEKDLRRKEKQKKLLKTLRSISSKVAIFLLAIIVTVSILTISVDAFRVQIFNLFMEEKERYTEIRKTSNINSSDIPHISPSTFYYPSYIPDGYKYADFEASDDFDFLTIVFEKDEEHINFDQDRGRSTLKLDTENAKVSDIDLGEKGLLIEKDGWTMIFWSEKEYSFTLIGYTDANELIKMAKSIKKIKK